MVNGKPITNDKIYEQIQAVDNRQSDKLEAIRLELKGDISRVENKIDTAISNRIDKLEDKVYTLQNRQSVDNTKLAILIASISIIVSATATVIVSRIIGSGH